MKFPEGCVYNYGMSSSYVNNKNVMVCQVLEEKSGCFQWHTYLKSALLGSVGEITPVISMAPRA